MNIWQCILWHQPLDPREVTSHPTELLAPLRAMVQPFTCRSFIWSVQRYLGGCLQGLCEHWLRYACQSTSYMIMWAYMLCGPILIVMWAITSIPAIAFGPSLYESEGGKDPESDPSSRSSCVNWIDCWTSVIPPWSHHSNWGNGIHPLCVCMCVSVCMFSHSVMSLSLWPHRL